MTEQDADDPVRDAAEADIKERKWKIWRGLTESPRPLPQLLDEAMELATIAGEFDQKYDGANSVCAYDEIISIYEKLDHVGYAEEIERICRGMLERTSLTSQCHFCMRSQLFSAQLAQGKHDEASATAAETRADLEAAKNNKVLSILALFGDWRPHHEAFHHMNMAEQACDLGDADKARKHLKPALRADFDSAAAIAIRSSLEARILLVEGKLDEALKLSDRAQESLPKHNYWRARLYLELAKAYRDRGDRDKARSVALDAAETTRFLKASRLHVQLLLLARECSEQADGDALLAEARAFADELRSSDLTPLLS